MLENLTKLRDQMAEEIGKAKEAVLAEFHKAVSLVEDLEKNGVPNIFADGKFATVRNKLAGWIAVEAPTVKRRGRKGRNIKPDGHFVGNGKQTNKALVLATLGNKTMTVQEIYDRVNAIKRIGKPSLGQVLVQLKKAKAIKSPKRGEWKVA
jgi:hypothetical protein